MTAAKEREKALKLAQKPVAGSSTSVKPPKKKTTSLNTKLPSGKVGADQQEMDILGLNLNDKTPDVGVLEEPPKITIAREKVIEEARRVLDAESQNHKKGVSIVVIGKWNLFPLSNFQSEFRLQKDMLMPVNRRSWAGYYMN